MNSTYTRYFLILRYAFRQVENHHEITISMKEFMELFFCTQRNAKVIMNKLTEERVIEFHSGRGRGNKSTVRFLFSLEEILKQQIEFYLKNQEIHRAIELVKEFGVGTEVEDDVMRWLREYFGYCQVHEKNRQLDLLRFPIYRPITTVDPSRIFFDLDAHLVMQVFNTLVYYDYSNKEFLGSLAHSWEANQERTKWLFFLRKGVLFHNGKELTAEAVKCSILRLKESPHRWLVEDISEIEIISGSELLFQLTKPNELFLQFIAYAPMSIVDVSDRRGGFVEFPSGTGPFQIAKADSDFFELHAFGSYFEKRPHMDRIEIIRMSESVRDTFLEESSVAVLTGEKEEGHPEWEEKKTMFSGTSVLAINSRKKGPLQEEGFRQKIHQLLCREMNLVASGFVVEGQKPKNLRNMLFEDSETDGEIAACKLSLYTYNRHESDAYRFQKQLNKYGVELDVKIVEWTMIQTKEVLQDADMLLFEGTPNEGIISVMDLFLCENGFIYPFLSDSLRMQVKEQFHLIKRTKASADRYGLYREMESYLQEKGVLLFIANKQVEAIYSHLLEGVNFSSRMWVDFKNLWYKHNRIIDF